jgi:hypothetical protein
MRRFSTLALAMAVLAAMTGSTEAQIQNVLLEQHTGAWCGWCPDGTVKMTEIVDLAGGQVIGVKIHTGDAMEIAEGGTIAGTLGLSGIPAASVDRRSFGGEVFLNRGDWGTACESEMRRKAKGEVDCFYTLDSGTRTVKIRVVANIVESMNFPVRFNAFIVEDDVTGTGSGYDQHNYYSGRPGAEGHPYYSQPATLVGYHHMKVVRKMLGGAWGVTGGLPAAVKAGQLYSYTFTATLSAQWNLDKLWFVGVLQANAPDNKEILNCAVAIKDGASLNRIIDSGKPAAAAVPTDANLVNTYTLENTTDTEQEYTVALSTTDRTPADWSAQFTSGDVQLAGSRTHPATGHLVVPAHATVPLSLTLNVGSTLGLGDAQVDFTLQGTPTIKRSRTLSAITQGIQHLLLESGSEYSLRPYLTNTACAGAVTLDPGDYLAFADQLPDVKVVIWNKGPIEGLSADEAAAIQARQGRTFLCGDGLVGSLENLQSLSDFGLEWIGWNIEGGSTGINWFSGQDGDVITGDLGTNIEGRLIYYYVDMVKITDTANVFPILHFRNDGRRCMDGKNTYAISAADTIFGVRSTKNNTRTVFLGISPYVIANQQTRRTLVANILNWLAE